MHQLGPLDAIFLYAETPHAPCHVGGLSILDPSTHAEFSFDRLREVVGERLALCPRFTWRLQEVPLGLDLPYWVDDERFDLDRHLHRIAVPAPGGMRELADVASYLFSLPLDRDRPLWEAWLIEGLSGGRAAMLMKTHHCLMDGVSGAGLAEYLCDLSPEPAEGCHPAVTEATATEPPSALDVALRGAVHGIMRPAHLARHLGRLAAAARSALGSPDSALLPTDVPKTSFNAGVGPRRTLAVTEISLKRVKELRKHFDVTVNDVLLALTGSALGRYLEKRGELPERSLVALVPISTRRAGDVTLGNEISEMSVSWASDVRDPAERLLRIHRNAKRAKETVRSSGVNLMAMLGDSLAPGGVQLTIRAARRWIDRVPLPGNAVVSFVRTAPFPLYMAGARVEHMQPFSVLTPGQGLNFTALSYMDHIDIGITADPDLVPNAWLIADAIPKALVELEEAAARRAKRAR